MIPHELEDGLMPDPETIERPGRPFDPNDYEVIQRQWEDPESWIADLFERES